MFYYAHPIGKFLLTNIDFNILIHDLYRSPPIYIIVQDVVEHIHNMFVIHRLNFVLKFLNNKGKNFLTINGGGLVESIVI